MMKKLFIKWGVLLFLSLCVISCDKDEITEDSQQSNDLTSQNFSQDDEGLVYSALGSEFSKTQARTIFAKTLAVTIGHNPELKHFIYEKAHEMFNGDYEVLYLMIKDEQVNGQPIHEMLKESSQEIEYEMNLPENFFKEEVLKADPYITVYVDEIYFEEPQLYEAPISVGILPAEGDDTQIEAYMAFTMEGEMQYVSEYTEDTALIGIKENERVVLINTETLDTINQTSLQNILFGDPCDSLYEAILGFFQQYLINGNPYLLVQVEQLTELYRCMCQNDCDPDSDGDGVPDSQDDCPDEAGSPDNNGCPEDSDCNVPNCDRTSIDKKDEIYRFKFSGCSAFKKTGELFEGKREMRAVITYGYLDPLTNTVVTSKIKKSGTFSKSSLRSANWLGKCKGTKWVTAHWESFNWDYCTHGEQIKVFWYEEDPGQWGTFNLNFTFKKGPINLSANVGIPLTNKDDKLGESVIQYCDGATGSGSLYNTGDIQFYYKLQ